MEATANKRVVNIADGVILEVLGPGSTVPRGEGIPPKVIVSKGWLLRVSNSLMEKNGGNVDAVLKATGQEQNPELSYRQMKMRGTNLVLWHDEKTGDYCSLFTTLVGEPQKSTPLGLRMVTKIDKETGEKRRQISLVENKGMQRRGDYHEGYA